jgi:YaiO family outer membrane protein
VNRQVNRAVKQVAGLVVLCATTFAACATDAPPPSVQAELAHESSHLSNGSPDWRETSLRLTQQLSQRSVRSVALTQTSRFGLQDQEVSALVSLPLADKLTASVEGSFSPTHRVLARQSLAATLQYEFQPTWIAHLGLGHRRYDGADVDSGLLMIEHYFSDFSASAAWKPVRASGSSASSTELRASYYYGDANSVGLILSQGSEPTTLGPGVVVLTDVKAVALLGRHWVNPQWAITYALSQTRQGDFYTRRSVRLGAKHVF